MKDNFDNLLHKAMTPDMEPSAELNEKILSSTGTSKKKSKLLNIATRVAAVALGLALISPAVAFAAEQIRQLRNAHITEDSISMGDSEYIDAANEDRDWNVTGEVTNRVEGTANDKWLYKEEIQLSNSLKNTLYGYVDYKTALEDTKMDNWLSQEYEKAVETGFDENVLYCISGDDDCSFYSIEATFKSGEGYFHMYQERAEGKIEENATFTLQLTKTENEREYVNKAGAGFVLVDDRRSYDDGEGGTIEELATMVIIKSGDYTGYFAFYNLSDEEIHQILDTVTVKNDGE